jgi:threonine dehydrogenase-like Zn-dependent dehydrogenase
MSVPNQIMAIWHLSPEETMILSEDQLGLHDGNDYKALYSLVSLGTERLVASGRVPLSAWEPMAVPFMAGSFSLPIKYGYSVVAENAQGDKFHIMHPHQNYVRVPPEAATLLPKSLPARRASLISNMETIWNAYHLAMPGITDPILIVGFGLIGALLANLLQIKGYTSVWIEDINPLRRELAREYGFKLLDDQAEDLPFDFVFHSSASEAGIVSSLARLRPEGKLIEMSWYGDQSVSLPLGTHFHFNRLQILSCQVSEIPGLWRKWYDRPRRKAEVILWLLESASWDRFLDLEIPFENAPAYFKMLKKNQLNSLSLLLKY